MAKYLKEDYLGLSCLHMNWLSENARKKLKNKNIQVSQAVVAHAFHPSTWD